MKLGLAFLASCVVLGWAIAPRAAELVVKAPAVAKAQVGYPRFGGRLLKAARMIADTTLVSQARLSALSGVSATRISLAERGRDTLRTAEVAALWRVLVPMIRQRFGDDGLVWLYVQYQRRP